MQNSKEKIKEKRKNPKMVNCPFCGQRKQFGTKCCSWNYLEVGGDIPAARGKRKARNRRGY